MIRIPSVLRRPAPTLGALLTSLLILAGCGAREATTTAGPPPTVAPIFSNNLPTVAPRQVSTPRPAGSSSSGLSDAVVASRLGTNVREIPVFDNELSTDWSLSQSVGLRYDDGSVTASRSRPAGIEVVPFNGDATLYFTVRPDTRLHYEQDKILGVRFWLNGGPRGIGAQELAVTVVGSNAFTYWRDDDTSVEAAGRITDNGTIFDEQRIYFLGFESGIPANTWAEVTIWLENRILDPEYQYLTGIYIKGDKYVLNSYYVDDVSILVPAP